MKKIIAAVSGLMLVAGAAVAAPAAKHVAKSHTVAQKLVCPVTGESIASVKAAAGSSTYKGKTYYFCCSGCKPMFDKNPQKYIKTASAKSGTASHKM